MNDKERGIKERGIPKSKHDNHLGGFRFGDPSVPVPGSGRQTRPGALAPVDVGTTCQNNITVREKVTNEMTILEIHNDRDNTGATTFSVVFNNKQ